MSEYGYINSDDESDQLLQARTLLKSGCSRIVAESNGQFTEREKLIASMSKGDTLVVWRLDKCCSSIDDLARMLDVLGTKHIAFKTLCEKVLWSDVTDRLGFRNLVGIMKEVEQKVLAG